MTPLKKAFPKFEELEGFQTFRIVAHLKTPIILRGTLPLESLLAAAVFEESGLMGEEALAHVPIGKLETPEGAVWLASDVMFSGRFRAGQHMVVRGRHFTECGPDFYAPNPRSRIDGYAVNQGANDFKRLLVTYPEYNVSKLVWYAYGDMKQCLELLSQHQWIGKRRGSGFGEVAQVDAKAWDGNPILKSDGMPLRTIAVKKLPFINGVAAQGDLKVVSRVDGHPSWAHEPELCAVPLAMREEELAEASVPSGSEIFYMD